MMNNAKLLTISSIFGELVELLHCQGAWDVAFNEDDCRIRKDNALKNFVSMRRLAVNSLGSRKKPTSEESENKQFKGNRMMDNEYLIKSFNG